MLHHSPFLFFEGRRASTACETRARRLLVRQEVGRPEPCDGDHGGFLGGLLNRVNLPANSYRDRPLQRRTAACLRFLRVKTSEEAARKIEAEPHLIEATLNIALLGVTDFFRDGPVFDQLRDVVLPALLGKNRTLRVWSAACSGGHELYSVGMLLSDLGRLDSCELLGTDFRGEAIKQARAGVFDLPALARLETRWRERFFTSGRSSACAVPGLRGAIEWKVADLFAAVERGPWHLILWRNMAIYLEGHAAADLWRRLTHELAPGGYIVCGKADHPPEGLPLVRRSNCIYQRIPFE